MADPSHAADGGLISSLPGQIGAAALGMGVLWRLLVSFGRQDRAARMEAELRDELRQRLDQTQKDLDRMAHERNEAVQVRLKLETELRVTGERLAATRAERDDARAAVVRLQDEVERLTATNHRLAEDAAIADASADARCAPAPQPARPGPRPVPGERPWKA